MEQSVVEWLHEKLATSQLEDMQTNINLWFLQAKEMEKKQIIDAMDVCQRTDFYVKYEGAEQYYNETFKSK